MFATLSDRLADTFKNLRGKGRLSDADIDATALHAVATAHRAVRKGPGALPAASAPLLDITAEAHAAWAVRLFAS